jgi:hypothetical protein
MSMMRSIPWTTSRSPGPSRRLLVRSPLVRSPLRGRSSRVVEALGTPSAGLRPRPVREKGFPSNLLLD